VAASPGAAERLNGAGKLSVLVVDDHEVVQWGFRLLLGRQPWIGKCVAAATPDQTLEAARRHQPDVALIDLFLGRRSGAELCEPVREVSPRTRVLLISGAGWISPEAARAAGAAGFISKDWSAEEVANAVRMVGRGMTVFAPQSEGPAVQLSAREREVLELIGRGETNREIAARLFLSHHTIKDHTTALYRKLGVRNRVEAARRAEQLGLVGRRPE
jgi:DNA-binding NarL/FixJ family response regulator